jgi:hypothetical protein
MMVPVMRRPPDWPALESRAAAEGAYELEGAGGPEAPVGEVPVVEAGDEEHAREVKQQGAPNRDPADAYLWKENSQAAGMDDDVGDTSNPVYPVFFRVIHRGWFPVLVARRLLFKIGAQVFRCVFHLFTLNR